NVGKSSENIAITSMSLRDAPGGPQLFAGLFNSGSKPVRALLSVKVDGALRDSRSVDLQAGGDATLTIESLPLSASLVEAKLSVDDKSANMFAADDQAW